MVLSRITALSCAAFIALAGSPGVTRGQIPELVPQTEQLELTVQNIMKGPSLVGTAPSRLRWAPDGRSLYFVWKKPGEESEGLYRVGRRGGEPVRLADDEARRIEPMLTAVYSDDRRWGRLRGSR